MAPPPALRMCGMTAVDRATTERTLRSNTSPISSSVFSARLVRRTMPPALLTRTSMPPNFSTNSSASRRHSLAFDTSAWNRAASAPAPVTRVNTSCAASAERA
jgi:hypothetical protein